MNEKKATKKDLYYSHDHEWVDFQGTVAYIGVCHFKLIGFKQIHEILFKDPDGFRRKGDVIATIRYNDYKIDVKMPVDGKILEINQALVNGDRDLLLQNAETNGWIVSVAPAQPYDRKGLLIPKEYQFNGKGKYAK